MSGEVETLSERLAPELKKGGARVIKRWLNGREQSATLNTLFFEKDGDRVVVGDELMLFEDVVMPLEDFTELVERLRFAEGRLRNGT